MATAREFRAANLRVETLAWIGKAQAKTGDRRSAQETVSEAAVAAKQNGDASRRDSALFDVLDAQSKVGDVDGALATAQELGDDALPVSALLEIASNLPD